MTVAHTMILALLTAVWASRPPGPEVAVFGEWQVTSATCPHICAMDSAQADAWRGRTAFYSESIARFGSDSCSHPQYKTGIWTAAEFLGGFRVPPSRLGITSDSTIVVDIWCPDRWPVPGAFLMIKDHEHLLTVWDGVVFELTRQ